MKEKLRAITAAVSAIEKQFGKGAIMPLGGPDVVDVPVISTGSLGLDLALGVGGYPRGRVVEIFGPGRVGKTTLALHAIAACQRAGGVCAFVDTRHALDVFYAKRLGVDLSQFLVSQPDTTEQALEIVDQLCRTGCVDLVVMDDVDGVRPQVEIEGDDPQVMLQARLFSSALRKITAVATKQNVCVVFVREPRPSTVFGSNDGIGANSLKFYASVRLDVRKVESQDEGSIGVRVKVVKNKMAPPFREAGFEIYPGEGIDTFGEIVDLGMACGIMEAGCADVEVGGYVFDGTRIGANRRKAAEWLRAHPEAAEWIRAAVLKGGSKG